VDAGPDRIGDRRIVADVPTTGLGAQQRAGRDRPTDDHGAVQLELGDLACRRSEGLFDGVEGVQGAPKTCLGPDRSGVRPQVLAEPVAQCRGVARGCVGQGRSVVQGAVLGEFLGDRPGGPVGEHQGFDQRVAGHAVRAVDAGRCHFARGPQARQ